MYKLLIEECKKNNIVFLWGFTYADKPFRKIGFEIPFKSTMANLVINPTKSAAYFYSITAKKNISSYLKILGLSYASYFKFLLLKIRRRSGLKLQIENIDFNTPDFNYLQYPGLFGLKLDDKFMEYRIHKNPYSKSYKTVSLFEEGVLKASVVYNINKEKRGFIIHSYFDKDLSENKSKNFIKEAIFQTDLKKCFVIRYWGFKHNVQNADEASILKKNHFVFLNQGISFVGLNLKQEKPIKFTDFVLSRMASQGTD